MDTEPIVPKKLTKFERTLQKVAPQVILDSAIGGLLTWFEMEREIAMKGYTSLMSAMPSMQKNSEPTFRPPPESPWYHVGDLWDGYYFTAMLYWTITVPTLLLPDKIQRFVPEQLRLAIAFASVVGAISYVEAKDPLDIPAGVLGASIFVVSHLGREKAVQAVKKIGNKAIEELPKIAEKIKSLSAPEVK